MTRSSEEPGLFREEALRRHLDPGGAGEVLRVTPGWTRASFWLLATFAAACAAVLALARIQVYAGGPAIVRVDAGGTPRVEVFVRDRDASAMRPGFTLILRRDVAPDAAIPLKVARVGDVVRSPEGVRAALGLAPGDAAIVGGSVVVEAAWDDAAAGLSLRDGERGRGEVVVGEERLGAVLIPWFSTGEH